MDSKGSHETSNRRNQVAPGMSFLGGRRYDEGRAVRNCKGKTPLEKSNKKSLLIYKSNIRFFVLFLFVPVCLLNFVINIHFIRYNTSIISGYDNAESNHDYSHNDLEYSPAHKATDHEDKNAVIINNGGSADDAHGDNGNEHLKVNLNESKGRIVLQEGGPISSSNCQKYVLITSQRSGSTWTCNLFDLQDDVTCGGTEVYQGDRVLRSAEPMSKYSFMKDPQERSRIKWAQYEKELTAAFQDSIDANELCNPLSTSTATTLSAAVPAAAGFKLMFNQILDQFIEGGEIFDYFTRNDIAVIHLERQAKILRMESLRRGHLEGVIGTHEEKVVKELRKAAPRIGWDKQTIAKIHKEEEMDRTFENHLSISNSKYHKLIYEDMLSKKNLVSELEKVFVFLHTNQKSESLKLGSWMLQLHEPSCESRIMRYGKFRKKIAGTKTLAACDKLDGQSGKGALIAGATNSIENEQHKIAIFLNTYIHPNRTEIGSNIVSKVLHAINMQPRLADAEIYYSRFGHLDTPWPEKSCRGKAGHSCHELKASTEGNEVDTLQALYEYCMLPDNEHSRVIYTHSKGSYNPSGNNELLRKVLLAGVLSDECIDMPKDTCSACSTQFSTRPIFHYVGNMWVSDCTYIRKLIPPKDFTEAKEKVVHTMLNHTTPSEYIDDNVIHTTNLTSADGTQFLYQFPGAEFKTGVLESNLGIGRYAMEHYILSHPDARPCDVYSKRDKKVTEINYVKQFEMERLNWRLKHGIVKPKLNIVSDYIRQGGENHTYTINGADCVEPNHPWYGKEGRVYQYKALYPETGGPAKDSWLHDYWGHIKPISTERECIYSAEN